MVCSAGSSPRARGTVELDSGDRSLLRFIPACAGNGWASLPRPHAGAVHPRVRGERDRAGRAVLLSDGSSPRARGTALAALVDALLERFIPACAGNGCPPWPGRSTGTVHPRVRGERFAAVRPRLGAAGSSPRARGTVLHHGVLVEGQRFIPACAGNGPSESRAAMWRTVHPRVRGERGPEGDAVGRHNRFIPACAGNGSTSPPALIRAPVHPRVRGERFCSSSICSIRCGSSPRARGTGGRPDPGARRCRFIPACAGNGRPARTGRTRGPVHPRVRGERICTPAWSSICTGSSPRARGTAGPRSVAEFTMRFIPACAGNGETGRGEPFRPPVHPRVRGERVRPAGLPAPSSGSSPRARGTGNR